MTLIKRLLTASLPVALVGVITPTIASCSCHKSSFDYKYKDHINCLDKKYGDYHSRGDIEGAARIKAYKDPGPKINQEVLDYILIVDDDISGNFLFNELIASSTIVDGKDININEWSYVASSKTLTCVLNDQDSASYQISYGLNTESQKITLNIGTNYQFTSYAFYDCTLEN